MSISFGLGGKSSKTKSFAPKVATTARTALASESDEEEAEKKPKTLDEEALDALLGKTEKKTQLVIESASNDLFKPRASTDDAFKADADSRPEESSISNYDEVPIEGFGAALMNGMGWKDGKGADKLKGVTSKARTKIRPTSLGLGASAAPEGVELGAWGKGDRKSNRIDRSVDYSKRKNPKTGEIVTEEEYQKMRQSQQLVTGESRPPPTSGETRNERDGSDRPKGSRALENGRHSSRDRHRDRRSKHRDRSRSPDNHRSRRHEDRRDSDRKSQHDRERSRSRHRDSKREKDGRRSEHSHKRSEREEDYDNDRRKYTRHDRASKDERRHRDRDADRDRDRDRDRR